MESHAERTVKQGGWHEALGQLDGDLRWKSSLVGLSEATYSFVVRSLVDALPTNSNLMLWKKVISPSCGSCGSKSQTLLHVLNNCDRKLDLYTWRHNNVLLQLKEFIASKVHGYDILCDVCIRDSCFVEGKVHTIPIDLLQTNLRPDLVLVNRATKVIIIVELTVPFETNIVNAHQRKADRYAPLIAGLEELDFTCTFHSFVIGSRGIAAQGSCKLIREICKTSRKETKLFIQKLCHTVVKASYLIFHEKDNQGAKFSSILH